MTVDSKIVEFVYQNDVKSLENFILGMNYINLDQINLSCFKLQTNSDSTENFGRTRSGRLPSDNLRLIHIAAYYDCTETFLFLIDFLKKSGMSEKDILYLRTPSDYYPLHYAIINRSFEITMYIINRFPEQINTVEKGVPYFPITLAVFSGMVKFVDFLFQNPYKIAIPKDQVDQAYGYALSLGEYPCLKILLSNKDRDNGKMNLNETIQMRAASYCSAEVVELVLKNEHEDLTKMYIVNNEADCLLRRLMIVQPPKFKDQIIYLLQLIEGEKIEPNKGKQIRGVCHWMCYFCDVEIAEILFKNFDFDVNRIDLQFQTGPFMMIRDNLKENDIIAMLNILINNNFNVNYVPIVGNKLKQKTLLEFFVSYPKERFGVVKFLLEAGANPDAPSFIQNGKYETIRNYVKAKKGAKMKELFDKFPPPTEEK